jgi:hypothetical protein
MGTRLCSAAGRRVAFVLLVYANVTFAQTEIPLGQWRMHLSCNSIKHVTFSTDKIYGACESGIMIFDKTDNSLSTYTKLTGLSGTGITAIHFDPSTQYLIIAYEDGNLDFIKDNVSTNFDRLKNSVLITGSKKINHISARNGFAYLSADFGLVVFDLGKLELKETWRDIGAAGGMPVVRASSFSGDSIFLATDEGLQAGNINTNLLDFNSWKRFDSGVFTNQVVSVVFFDSRIYTAINGVGILHYENGNWTQEPYLAGLSYNFLSASAHHMFVGQNSNLWSIDENNAISSIVTAQMNLPQSVIEDSQEKIWIGDSKNGLLSNASGVFTSFIVNGPNTNAHFRLQYHDHAIFSVTGGFSSGGTRLGNSGIINVFHDGLWTTEPALVGDITDIEFFNDKRYVSSFGDGVEENDGDGNKTVLNETNSPLQKVTAPDGVFVTAMEWSADGLWLSNYRATQPLRFLNKEAAWESFSPVNTLARYATDIKTDFAGNLWLAVNPSIGGGLIVFNKDDNFENYFTESPTGGNLPNRNILSMVLDRDGYLWLGTESGVAYFFDRDEDVVKPIFENRFLLRDDRITAIEVDGGNRKWIGTENGVWLFNSTGEALIFNFTEENSPLLSNRIRDIEINPITGEVFFATDRGIVSYRGDATSSTTEFLPIKIFPNPVAGDFSGMVSISGLATDAYVKITDVSGKLVWQTQANGGTATWNVRNFNNTRASTGVYLVFAASLDGSERAVGKIVVID